MPVSQYAVRRPSLTSESSPIYISKTLNRFLPMVATQCVRILDWALQHLSNELCTSFQQPGNPESRVLKLLLLLEDLLPLLQELARHFIFSEFQGLFRFLVEVLCFFFQGFQFVLPLL